MLDDRRFTLIRSLLSLKTRVVIAHRGGAKLGPENTLVAFDQAIALGVDGCECDVHLSADGDAVVIHDASLDRTTNAQGPVEARTVKELAQIDAGFTFAADGSFPFRDRGIGIPRLVDLLDRHRSVPWVIEIKGERVDLVRAVIRIVSDLGAEDRVIIGGFSHIAMDAVRRLAPRVATGASRREARRATRRAWFRLPPGRHAFSVLQMPLRVAGREVFGEPFVRYARRSSVPVHAWVIDDPNDMTRLTGWGVTGLITDRPDVALATAGRET